MSPCHAPSESTGHASADWRNNYHARAAVNVQRDQSVPRDARRALWNAAGCLSNGTDQQAAIWSPVTGLTPLPFPGYTNVPDVSRFSWASFTNGTVTAGWVQFYGSDPHGNSYPDPSADDESWEGSGNIVWPNNSHFQIDQWHHQGEDTDCIAGVHTDFEIVAVNNTGLIAATRADPNNPSALIVDGNSSYEVEGSIQALSDGPEPLGVGSATFQTPQGAQSQGALFYSDGSGWNRHPLKYWNFSPGQFTQMPDLPSNEPRDETFLPWRINERGEMAGGSYHKIYRNGRMVDFADAIGDLWVALDGDYGMFLNNRGVALSSAVNAENQSITALLVPCDVVPDFNRDGTIDNKDRGKITKDHPWRWWVNEDNDNGDVSNEDAPLGVGNGNIDSALGNNHIDGTCDLIDFFPLYLDIKQLIEVLPPAQYSYRLKQENTSLNFVYTDLKPDEAGKYLRDAATADSLKTAQAYIVFANGAATLSTTFLNKIKDEDKGVILLEGGSISDKPLYLQVFKGGDKVCEVPFYLKVDNVEKMYRWVNLRGVAGQSQNRATDTNEPPNYPDKEANGKMFIMVHGYNVNEQQSRGWASEAFKRLYQSGSKAMFTGVSWHGDSSQIPGWVPFAGGNSPDYWENVTHAFQTSQALANAVNGVKGSVKVIAAHSLGNMVVSSAIKDHSMNVDKCFLLDAAVPIEAYDQSMLNPGEMRDPDWQNYETRLWASNWYQLFAGGDGRNKLTWRNRFGSISVAYNFYSLGEDVLENATGQVPGLGAERAWALQEMVKGTGHLGAVATLDSQAAWGFGTYWDITEMFPDPQHPEIPPEPYTRRRYPNETQEITNDDLKLHPFFRDFQDTRLVDANQGSAAAHEYLTRAKALAEAIPALSFGAGRNPVTNFEERNIDLMNLKNDDGAWPPERLSDPTKIMPNGEGRWLHGDAKDIAYRYNYKLYQKWVELGELK